MFSYFSEIFKESDFHWPCLDGIVFLSFFDKDNFVLTTPFSLQELDGIIC